MYQETENPSLVTNLVIKSVQAAQLHAHDYFHISTSTVTWQQLQTAQRRQNYKHVQQNDGEGRQSTITLSHENNKKY